VIRISKRFAQMRASGSRSPKLVKARVSFILIYSAAKNPVVFSRANLTDAGLAIKVERFSGFVWTSKSLSLQVRCENLRL